MATRDRSGHVWGMNRARPGATIGNVAATVDAPGSAGLPAVELARRANARVNPPTKLSARAIALWLIATGYAVYDGQGRLVATRDGADIGASFELR